MEEMRAGIVSGARVYDVLNVTYDIVTCKILISAYSTWLAVKFHLFF